MTEPKKIDSLGLYKIVTFAFVFREDAVVPRNLLLDNGDSFRVVRQS